MSNPVKAIIKPLPSSSWIPNSVIICLLLLTAWQRLSIENNACTPSYGGQRLLYSAYLNYGRVKVPSTLQGYINPASNPVRLLHLAFMVLLASDVEINPGPHPLNINFQDNLAPQQAQLAHTCWLTQPWLGPTWPVATTNPSAVVISHMALGSCG